VNPDSHDERIRHLFHKVREQDERETPSFSRTWNVARSRQRQDVETPWALAFHIATALFIAIGVAAVLLMRPTTQRDDLNLQVAAGISSWQSPTDFLLSTPGSQFIQSVPSIGNSLTQLGSVSSDQNQ
jgi:hypothetical protein